ncbi:universal stress protein [Haladaptatus sp. DYSN1]|uniref:universal stress protein n=1 Tax=unclassified Haladaptatus TaxID=2622732 RepID=UPI00240664A6|nr:universal stress protein [Haladaptatus sp. DYSN1]
MAIETILVPTDGTPLAVEALRHALVEYPNAAITALHVIDFRASENYPGGWGEAPGTWEAWMEEARAAETTLFEQADEIAAEYDREIEHDSVVGPTSRTILDYLDTHGFDLVVMGSHGREGVSRILLGSVAESVTRRSPTPVVVVR